MTITWHLGNLEATGNLCCQFYISVKEQDIVMESKMPTVAKTFSLIFSSLVGVILFYEPHHLSAEQFFHLFSRVILSPFTLLNEKLVWRYRI